MKPKTKPEPKVQIKISLAKSVAQACDLARKEAEHTAYDWNATMAEALEKANSEFLQFLAQDRTNAQPDTGLNSSPRSHRANGSDLDHA